MQELTDDQIEALAERLRALQGELRGGLRSLQDGARTVDLDQPIGRLTRIDALQQQSMAKANRDAGRVRLQQVEAALRRVADGSYGYCLDCDEPIGDARLRVRPEAFLCIACQERREP